jgi:hypothetical protein
LTLKELFKLDREGKLEEDKIYQWRFSEEDPEEYSMWTRGREIHIMRESQDDFQKKLLFGIDKNNS